MRLRTYLGLLFGVGVVVAASFLAQENREFLAEPFRLGGGSSLPLGVVLLLVFLTGLLPPTTVLLVGTIRRDLALREERRARREADSLAASFRRAVDLQADGQWQRAAAELEVVLAARPDNFSALLCYGEVLRKLGRFEDALEIHRRASVHHPQSVALLYQLADDYQARREPEVAEEIRNRVLRDFPGMGLAVLSQRRDGALAARRFPEAALLQQRIEDLAGPRAAGLDGEREEAVRRGLAYQRAVADLESERVEEAAATCRRLFEEDPRFIPAAILLGEAELVREREEAALEVWLAGYRQTGSPVFLQRIEDHFIEREEPRRAIETLRRLIAEAENDLLPRFFLGRLYYRLEMHGEAQKLLASLGDRIDSSPTYHYLLARIHERRGELARALEHYRACARQLGVPESEYRCRVCRASYAGWQDRCEACGAWNSVELDFEEERVAAEAPSVLSC
jgi:predicted Zn-dependent protease